MKNRILNCSACSKTISEKTDLNILQYNVLFTRTFCNSCYISKHRNNLIHNYLFRSETHILSNTHVFKLALSTVFALIAGFILFFGGDFKEKPVFIILFIAYSVVVLREWTQFIEIRNTVNKLEETLA